MVIEQSANGKYPFMTIEIDSAGSAAKNKVASILRPMKSSRTRLPCQDQLILCWGTISCLACTLALAGDTPISSVLVASNLRGGPVYVTHARCDFDRVFIVEQHGTIRVLDISQNPPVLLGAPFLDIQSRVVDSGKEQGLLGLAFHPDFQNNGFFYVNYTGPGGATRISRFRVSAATPNDADETSEFILLTIHQPRDLHNGGWLEFGPDGFLYIATGDGGPSDNAQDITDNLLGKILRIDVEGTNAPSGTYGIPADNPFVGITGDDEIWAYGLRNPWRNSFDPLTGDLYIADVGQRSWEEVNFQPASSGGGENWGWPCREGAHLHDGNCGSETLLDPIHEYSHLDSSDNAIIGGQVYRGCAMPALGGTYFFGDFGRGQIWSFRFAGSVTEFRERTAELNLGSMTSFGRDAFGELYICSEENIFKITSTTVLDCNANAVPDECDSRGDFDGDGLTTLRDFAAFQRCFTGISAIADPCCRLLDFDANEAVNLTDYAAFHPLLTGP